MVFGRKHSKRRSSRHHGRRHHESKWRNLDEVRAEELEDYKKKKRGKVYKFFEKKAKSLGEEMAYRRAAEAQIKKKSKAAYYAAKEKAMIKKAEAKARDDARRPGFFQSLAASTGRMAYESTKPKSRKGKGRKKPFITSPLDNMPNFPGL